MVQHGLPGLSLGRWARWVVAVFLFDSDVSCTKAGEPNFKPVRPIQPHPIEWYRYRHLGRL